MKVTNRSAGDVGYSLPELGVRRSFNRGDWKEISQEEIFALSQAKGGLSLIKNYLLLDDKEYVKKEIWHDAPIEYFWGLEDVKKCVLEDSKDLFAETLDYAPEGVVDLIKEYAWRLPMTDLNKIQILKEKTGFDAQMAQKVMAQPKKDNAEKPKGARLRRE